MINKNSALTKFLLVSLLVSTVPTQTFFSPSKMYKSLKKKFSEANKYVKCCSIATALAGIGFAGYKLFRPALKLLGLKKPPIKQPVPVVPKSSLFRFGNLVKLTLLSGIAFGGVYLFKKLFSRRDNSGGNPGPDNPSANPVNKPKPNLKPWICCPPKKKQEPKPKPKPKQNKKQEPKECGICMDDKNQEDFVRLECGHDGFCKGCLGGVIDTAIKDKKTVNVLRCPQCPHIITHQEIVKITNNYNKLNQIDNIQLKEGVKKVNGIRFCPTPDCKYCWVVDNGSIGTVACPMCNQQCCSNCCFPHSFNMSCEEHKKMRDSNKSGNNDTWIEDQINKGKMRRCPGCRAPIEKNEGCNHMTCKCGHEFCWVCYRSYEQEYNYGLGKPVYHKQCECELFNH
ncbi:RBR family RING finger protein [Candidatus Dependentiae bacterium]